MAHSTTKSRQTTVPAPGELTALAEALRPALVERQAETERRTYYSQETHEAFLEAGFYRMLVPRRFGGYEFALPDFWRVVIAIARAPRRRAAPGRPVLDHAGQSGVVGRSSAGRTLA